MYSSTDSFDSSLLLNDSGSSRTSPSRLPRMFVEYQPSRSSKRALKAGASTVFIIVWPVLKSLPPTGTPFFLASSIRAGVSTVRLGAPLRSEEHTSELQSQSNLVCRLLLEKKKK